MKLIYGMGGIAMAQAVAVSMGAYEVEKVETPRALQTTTGNLCTTTIQSTPEHIDLFCGNKIQTLATDVNWTPCCTFQQDPGQGDMCRQFETDGEYCNDGQLDCATELGDDHTLTLSLKFEDNPEQTCCKSCTCFGDPECVSFDGTADLWIPCDGRRRNCKIRKKECLALTDPNGNTCHWRRPNARTSQGWNIGLLGSPCVPANLATAPEISMNMYTNADNTFSIDLALGERGVIKTVHITRSGSKTSMSADDCFASTDANSWSGLSAVPLGWSRNVVDDKETRWTVYDSDSQVLVKLLCARAVEGDAVGAPRINVEEVSVHTSSTGSGFCATGNIADKKGSDPGSAALHASCVQDQADPLQACKHLVSMAATLSTLGKCGEQFCTTADLTAAQRTDCIAQIGDGTSNQPWKEWYCKALATSGSAPSGCEGKVQSQGWNFAVTEYGKGTIDTTPTETCANSISEYALANKMPCVDGISIETSADGGTTWTERYFIPHNKPPCSGELTVNPTEALKLFTESVRLRQCDIKADDQCKALGSCLSTHGAQFSLSYSSTAATLTDLFNQGVLACQPRTIDGVESTTWCMPGGSDYQPSSDLCPCPTEDEQTAAGRRALLGQ